MRQTDTMKDGTFSKSRQGVVFQQATGKLYIFKPDSVTVLAPWPHLKAWIKTKNSPNFRATRWPLINLSKIENIERSIQYHSGSFRVRDQDGNILASARRRWAHLAWLKYQRNVPLNFRGAIVKFHPYLHWPLLSILSTLPPPIAGYFLQLMVSSPALGAMLSTVQLFKVPAPTHSNRSVGRLLARRGVTHRDILNYLGLPCSNQVAKIFRKVHPQSCSPGRLKILIGLLYDTQALQLLTHVLLINGNILQCLADVGVRKVITPGFLEDMARGKNLMDTAQAVIFKDTFRMHRQLFATPFPGIRTENNLLKLHNSYISKINKKKMEAGQFIFPPPPFVSPDPDALEYIHCAENLLEEGKLLNHCCFSYIQDLASGQKAIYRIYRPERATLMINKRKDDTWYVSQLFGPGNRQVKAATKLAVKAFFKGIAGACVEYEPYIPESAFIKNDVSGDSDDLPF